jgi:hypothetical protein
MSKKKRWEKPRPKALKQPADEKTDSRIIAVAKGCCAGTYGMQAMALQDAQLLYDWIIATFGDPSAPVKDDDNDHARQPNREDATLERIRER